MFTKEMEEDVTTKEFKNKKNSKYKITDERLKNAAGYALIEARKWDAASEILHKNERLRSQTCVNALFSIEMYLKSILLNLGINVTTKKYGHKIYDMYGDLDSCLKAKIKRNIKVDKVVHKSLFNEVIKFNSFEEELQYISNDFMYLRYEYEKFINGMQIITLTDFIMFLKLNCRKIATKIFSKRSNVGKEIAKIEIVEGYNANPYFGIMPVKIKDRNRSTNDTENVEKCRELEISIEEEDINSYLRPILLEVFNNELEENKKREINIIRYIKPEEDPSFESYWTYNYFTFDDIQKLITRIKYISELLQKDYHNIELNKIRSNYDWILYGLPEYDGKEMYKKEKRDKLVEKNINLIIDFYQRFVDHIEKMIVIGKEKGYSLISFIGP